MNQRPWLSRDAVGAAVSAGPDSIRLEDIAGAAHGLEIAGEFRVALDLAPEPRHLHVDGADIAAELRLLGQCLARYRDTGAAHQRGQQRGLGGGQMHRLLAAEQLIAACPTLQPWSAGTREWRIDNLEASLAFLEEVQAAPLPVGFEWPDGEPVKVSPAVSAKHLSLKVSSQRDWFEISGRIAVDEDLVIDMQDVLARLDKARHAATALQGFAPGAMLSQVVQRAMIEIDEEGAEAAAATAVMSSRALGADEAIDMVVDKPFVYALRDKVTGLILVAGYVGQPPKRSASA